MVVLAKQLVSSKRRLYPFEEFAIGETLPKSVLNAIRLSNVRFYVGVTNLFTITGYDGLDPETQQDLPIPRTVNFGLSLNL